ncbi:MAG: hypothetical protein CVT48_01170 [Thermoplasmata archaeon HGW-Thermoplasmata-1]|nr:MAG: hypothetical protein CVT48_01170 [Thermoplasmata archaeon HGW-Thermoplasmata-1]
MSEKTVDEIWREEASVEWEDEDVDTDAAVKIILKHNPSGRMTILDEVHLPESDDPDAPCTIKFNLAGVEIMGYLTKKYGRDKGFFINAKITRKLFFGHLQSRGRQS